MTGGGGNEGSLPPRGPVRHTPVLLPQVLTALAPKDGGLYIDCTFGAGGYTRAILDAANCRVLALDRDPDAVASGRSFIQEFGDRIALVESRFAELADVAEAQGFSPADGVVFDLGVSSMQLDEAGRGFSFMRDGPLDMRMSSTGVSAADVVNTFEQDAIADILYQFGEERRSRAIARTIVAARAEKPLERTSELAALCVRVLGQKPGDKHAATRTFQALRLYVNDELDEVSNGLAAAESVLRPGGRLAVVTFHSLEDRIAKQFLNDRAGRVAAPSRHAPAAAEQAAPTFRLITRKPVEPTDEEVAANPRARSAKLRAAIKLDPTA